MLLCYFCLANENITCTLKFNVIQCLEKKMNLETKFYASSSLKTIQIKNPQTHRSSSNLFPRYSFSYVARGPQPSKSMSFRPLIFPSLPLPPSLPPYAPPAKPPRPNIGLIQTQAEIVNWSKTNILYIYIYIYAQL